MNSGNTSEEPRGLEDIRRDHETHHSIEILSRTLLVRDDDRRK
jgi:hypothetical protein